MVRVAAVYTDTAAVALAVDAWPAVAGRRGHGRTEWAATTPGSRARSLFRPPCSSRSLEFDVLLANGLGKDEGRGDLALPAAQATNRVALAASVIAEHRASSDAVGRGWDSHRTQSLTLGRSPGK